MIRKDQTMEDPTDADMSPADDSVGAEGAAEGGPETEAADAVEALHKELAECKDKLLRAQAECANISRRLHQQQIEAVRYAPMGLAREVLNVVDSLERSLANMEASQADKALVDGVRLIADQLIKVMKDHGITPIEAVGKAFDPMVHEAMLSDPSSDEPPGTVTSELVRGYRMFDRVLRPSKVVVAAEKQGDPNGHAE